MMSSSETSQTGSKGAIVDQILNRVKVYDLMSINLEGHFIISVMGDQIAAEFVKTNQDMSSLQDSTILLKIPNDLYSQELDDLAKKYWRECKESQHFEDEFEHTDQCTRCDVENNVDLLIHNRFRRYVEKSLVEPPKKKQYELHDANLFQLDVTTQGSNRSPKAPIEYELKGNSQDVQNFTKKLIQSDIGFRLAQGRLSNNLLDYLLLKHKVTVRNVSFFIVHLLLNCSYEQTQHHTGHYGIPRSNIARGIKSVRRELADLKRLVKTLSAEFCD